MPASASVHSAIRALVSASWTFIVATVADPTFDRDITALLAFDKASVNCFIDFRNLELKVRLQLQKIQLKQASLRC